jgi:hypothetical protein
MRYGRTLGICVISIISLLATSGVASAKRSGKRIVLMGVAGAPQAEKDLAKFLRSEGQVIGQKEYIRVATQLGATGTEPDQVAKVAARLGVAAIVAGKVEKEHGGLALKIVLREGASGRIVAKLRYPMMGARLDTNLIARLREDVAPVIAQSVAPGGGVGAQEIDASNDSSGGGPGATTPRGETGGPDDENPLIAARAKEKTSGEHHAAPTKDAGEEPTGPRLAQNTVLELSAGVGFSARNYSTSNMSEPSYSSGQIPGFRLDAAVFPAASLGKLAGAFGIDARFEKSATFNSQSPTMAGNTQPTDESAFSIGLRARWIVRDTADSPVLSARLGYGQRTFAISGDQNFGVPEIDYAFATVGAFAKVPLGSPKFAIEGGIEYHAVTGAGPIVQADQYGAATVNGFHAQGGIAIVPLDWLILRAGADYTRFGFAFTGGGAKQADTATDEYVGGFLTAGYLY